ncbi:MAG: cytochrome c oxidase subunit II [Planctomycetota bacterium]|nr:MAG: cytochrome c oxidase subunit II [Planctomycetota bacterium]
MGDVSIFSPASPQAGSIVTLSWLVFAVAAFIFVVVEGVLFYCVFRFRHRGEPTDTEPPQVYGSHPIEIAWTVAPSMIVFFLVLVGARTLWEVNIAPAAPTTESADESGVLDVTVVGRQWWWEYQYKRYDGRELSIITANELHIPASDAETPRSTRLALRSADVCHSFWVPRLGGKMDVIPGRHNTLWLETDKPGLYLGQCAEYCGTQHAHMLIRVVVDSPADFERWLESQAKPAVEDAEVSQGREAFLSESCVNCHRIRGTTAHGNYAPDLTHLMSRKTIAGAAVENNAENLEHWVHDPQDLKPGCLMPAFGLTDKKQQMIVRYLLTLE